MASCACCSVRIDMFATEQRWQEYTNRLSFFEKSQRQKCCWNGSTAQRYYSAYRWCWRPLLLTQAKAQYQQHRTAPTSQGSLSSTQGVIAWTLAHGVPTRCGPWAEEITLRPPSGLSSCCSVLLAPRGPMAATPWHLPGWPSTALETQVHANGWNGAWNTARGCDEQSS